MTEKKARGVGAYRASSSQERLEKLVEFVLDEVYDITEHELSKIYPEKNWFDDNFASNLYGIALQLTSSIQTGIVQRRASQITEGEGK